MIETIGILGGGQLGRMLTLEAKRMGYRVVTLEPIPNSPTGQVADEQIVGGYDDLRLIGELGARSDVVTYEFENIPLDSVRALEVNKRLVRPSADVLRVTQNRLLEKMFVRQCDVPTAEFAGVLTRADLDRAIARIELPGVLKTVYGGYDGKGQWVIRDRADLGLAFSEGNERELIYERFIPFQKELSIISARNARGEMIHFPVAENIHDHGVLATTIVPARVDDAIADQVRAASEAIAKGLGIVGAFAVEFFLYRDQVLVNEIAPRVHNSGHYSLDATQISQYEAHVRAICDLPLVAPRLLAPAVMVNILGTGSGDRLAGVEELLRDPDVKLHMYGKSHAAMRRKMGHFTVLGTTLDEALERAERLRGALSWVRKEAATAGNVAFGS